MKKILPVIQGMGIGLVHISALALVSVFKQKLKSTVTAKKSGISR